MPDGTPLGPGGAQGALLTLPNVITFGRLCAVPVAVWLVVDEAFAAAFYLFVAAGLSDALDGWLARRSGGGSAVGAVLDPVADKALLVSMYVTLAAVKILPVWLAILVVFRDVLIVGGVLVLTWLGHAVTIRPILLSRLNTAMQIVLVAAALFLTGFPVGAPILLTVLIWATGATTLGSGTVYVWQAVRAR
jgi:cardiolipin synthase (CMP-forming)